MTISLGMIVRNEGRTLERCLESVKDLVDEIVIGLAGESTDDTAQIARKYTEHVFDIEWHEDFSEARNLVVQRCSGDWFLWLDGDDELVIEGDEGPGDPTSRATSLHQLIAANPTIEAFYWGYDYARDEQGNNTCYLVRERLIRLSPDWSWHGRVHEVFIGPPDHTKKLVPNIYVKHNKPSDKESAPERNLKILYQQLRESEPNPDPRVLSYLGSENASRGNLQEAILHWQRFVPLSGWDEERYQAQHHIADAWRALNELEKARQADFAAISIRPDWPDAYLGLAETAYRAGDFRSVVEWTKSASTKSRPQTLTIINPRDYDYDPQLILGLAYTQLGDYEMALGNFRKAFEIRPEESLQYQIKIITEELRLQNVVQAAHRLWEELARNDEWIKAKGFVENLPHSIQQLPTITDIRTRSYRAVAHLESPELMAELYENNPDWEPMSDEYIFSSEWLRHPRLQFAIRTARAIQAQNVLDLGCSDGFISLPLARALPDLQVTGVDIDARCIQLANQRVASFRIPHANFHTADLSSYRADVERFYDLALMFEVLEHVPDPSATLEQVEKSAKHIALTVPYLAWEQGQGSGWREPGPKPHVRIFDLEDMERMLASRGRIRNLYREPHGGSAWIFADYAVKSKQKAKVTIAAMGTFEPWSPKKLEAEGLGGSETAVIRLAEELAELGHGVSVFCDTDDPGYFNWVRYQQPGHFIPEVRSDLFIAWRAPELIDLNPNAQVKVLWMHDVDAQDRLTASRAAGFDHIVVLTEWHKSYMMQRYPFLREEQLIVMGNGVDVERFEGTEVRQPARVVYASSPDRGLDIILESIWPAVVEAVPSAELHLYYGWKSFDAAAQRFPQLLEFRNKIKGLLDESRNVVQHGRIPQDRLAREFMRSDIWLYPTYFSETYCITAVEAQLAGCIPITNQLAALSETVRSGIFINGDPRKPEVQQAFSKAVIEMLSNEKRDDLRPNIKKNTLYRTWAGTAVLWELLFIGEANGRSSGLASSGAKLHLLDFSPNEEDGSASLVPDVQ